MFYIETYLVCRKTEHNFRSMSVTWTRAHAQTVQRLICSPEKLLQRIPEPGGREYMKHILQMAVAGEISKENWKSLHTMWVAKRPPSRKRERTEEPVVPDTPVDVEDSAPQPATVPPSISPSHDSQEDSQSSPSKRVRFEESVDYEAVSRTLALHTEMLGSMRNELAIARTSNNRLEDQLATYRSQMRSITEQNQRIEEKVDTVFQSVRYLSEAVARTSVTKDELVSNTKFIIDSMRATLKEHTTQHASHMSNIQQAFRTALTEMTSTLCQRTEECQDKLLAAMDVQPSVQAAAVQPVVQAAAVQPAVQAATFQPAVQAAAVQPAVQAAAVQPVFQAAAVQPAVQSYMASAYPYGPYGYMMMPSGYRG